MGGGGLEGAIICHERLINVKTRSSTLLFLFFSFLPFLALGGQGQLHISSPSPMMMTSSSMLSPPTSHSSPSDVNSEFRVDDFVTMVIKAKDDKADLNQIDSRVTVDSKNKVSHFNSIFQTKNRHQKFS